MKVIVKATYTALATVEVDAHDWDSACNEVEKLQKNYPTEFLDTPNIHLKEADLLEIAD